MEQQQSSVYAFKTQHEAEERAAEQITAALNANSLARVPSAEQTFFAFYGTPLAQTLLGLEADTQVPARPDTTPERRAARQALAKVYVVKLRAGGFDEALARAVLSIVGADHSVDQRTTFALNALRQALMSLSLADFKALIRDQFFVLQLDCERAMQGIASMVPMADLRRQLVEEVTAIVSTGDPLTRTALAMLARLSQILAPTRRTALGAETPVRPAVQLAAQPAAKPH